MWLVRWLNWLGWRKDTLTCMCQEDTWQWPSRLGAKTEGVCSKCKMPIYFEIQNKSIRNKVCNRCSYYAAPPIKWTKQAIDDLYKE